MVKRRTLFLILYFTFLALITVLLYWFLKQERWNLVQQNPVLPLIFALLGPVLLAAGSIALRPVREFVDGWLRKDLNRDICRIFLFGSRGSGKTSLIKNIFTAEVLAKEASTETFDYYKRTIIYDLKGTTQFDVLIADYKGEQPSMVTVDLPEEFAGPKNDRAINVLFFIVDTVPRVLDEAGHVLGDDETIQWLRTESEAKIRRRIAEHLEYLTGPMMQIIFSAAYSPQLRSVRLIVTKLDLMQQAFDLGFLSPIPIDDIKQWIRTQFARVEHDARRASEANNIPDFSVHVVSSTQDIGMRAMLNEVWKTHLKATGVQIL
jgi:hypothetical protein